MKKYDVYAIGNALVDIEYHATPERLTELSIDKGVMTLIDEQRQNSLIAQLGDSHEKHDLRWFSREYDHRAGADGCQNGSPRLPRFQRHDRADIRPRSARNRRAFEP